MTKKNTEVEIKENIMKTEYSDEMQKSFLDYSMSVIVSRAIPDIRDGLKPVHRRILYAMNELGVKHDKPYRKCARIVGDTMGKYHPHGDSSIYDALVVMSQDWKKGEILVDGHGNFGSIEGDGAAADRYTEARLSQISEDLFLKDIDKDTVNFAPNFDEQEKEPVVLPARIPNVLVNGSEGIAVGMTTSTPPHNIKEVMDGYQAYIDNPKIALDELMKYVKGPDFPTGGIVVNKSELKNIYETGKGKIHIRGKIVHEKSKKGGKELLVITEIPYTMIGSGINKFLQDVADLVKDKRLPEVTDILNQSSKEGIRLVIELKKGSDIERVKNILYKKTRLEDTFGVNMLYVVDGKPETLSLKGVYEHFLKFQIETNTRKYKTLLKKEEQKAEIQEGLIKAIDLIDLIIEIIRGSKSTKDAKDCLMGQPAAINFKHKESEKLAKTLAFTERQAQAILDMKLSKLIGLEIVSLKADFDETMKLINKYKKLLSSAKAMLNQIKKENEDIIKTYGEERKTQLVDAEIINVKLDTFEEKNVYFGIDRFAYVKTYEASVFERNKESILQDNKMVFKCKNTDSLYIFTDTGNMHQIKCMNLPMIKAKDKGIPLDNISNFDGSNETIVNIFAAKQLKGKELTFATAKGLVKRLESRELETGRKTISSTKLSSGDYLIGVDVIEKQIIMQTNIGRIIRFNIEEIPVMKKNSVGVRGIRLVDTDSIEKIYDVSKIEEIKIGDKIITPSRIKISARGGVGTKIRI